MRFRFSVCRILAFSLLICVLLSCFSCKKKADVPMENYSWTFVKALHNGKCIHYAANDPSINTSHKNYAEATPIDVVCSIANGTITIADRTNNKTYTGTYSVDQSSSDGTQFSVKFNDVEGKAFTSSDASHGHAETGASMTITINYYILSFRAI